MLLLALHFFAFALPRPPQDNGYLAVYLAGLVIERHKLDATVADGLFRRFPWLIRIVMFLYWDFRQQRELLPEVLILGCAVGTFMILVARPV